jgi:hypothetical protein
MRNNKKIKKNGSKIENKYSIPKIERERDRVRKETF